MGRQGNGTPRSEREPNPARIMHTAAKGVTFTNVAAGEHTVVVWLSLSNHVSVAPAVSASVKFTAR
jgi:hypothetical protein